VSLELKPVQVRLNDEAYRALVIVAKVHHQGNLGEAGRVLLAEALLGKSHAIKVMAERLLRATRSGNER
jgi:hypothetical protein